MTVHRDDLQEAKDLLQIDNEDFKTAVTVDEDSAQEEENACEDLEKEVSRQKKEPREHGKRLQILEHSLLRYLEYICEERSTISSLVWRQRSRKRSSLQFKRRKLHCNGN